MKIKRKQVYIIAAVAVTTLTGAIIWGGTANSSRSEKLTVQAEKVTRSTIESTVTAQGEVSLLESDTVFINNTLEVHEILVRENDVVVQGQPLMTFNTNTTDRQRERERLEIQLRDAHLNLRSAEVALQNTKIPPTQTELENARLAVSRAEQGILDAEFAVEQLGINISQQERGIEQQQRVVEQQQRSIEQLERNLEQRQNALHDAEVTLSNTQVLFGIGAATQNQLDNAERAVENLQNDVINAENDIINARSNVENAISDISNREESIVTLRGQKRQAEQNITAAHDNLQFAKIQHDEIQNRLTNPQTVNSIEQQQIAIERMRLNIEQIQNDIDNLNDVESVLLSPISGTVTNIAVTRGEMATPGRALIEISDAQEYVLNAFVNERNAGNLRVGQEVLIESSILGDEVMHGRISNVGTVAQTNQVSGVSERVVPVEIRLDQSEHSGLLIPGVSLDVTITTETRENVIAIPILSTLSQREGESYVFVINSDNVLEQREVVLGAYADMYVEATGIEEGEIIVSQPTFDMVSGMEVIPEVANVNN